jgi:hypothetical protein
MPISIPVCNAKMPIHEPRLVRTIQDLIDHDMVVTAHCGRLPKCTHAREIDLEALREARGPDYVIIGNGAFTRALVCGKCGHKGGSITVSSRYAIDPRKLIP